jgi:integrase
MKFTLANVARTHLPPGKTEHIVFDEVMPGFGLRIRGNGKNEHRTYIAQYKIGSKHRRMTLGSAAKVTLENARAHAKKIFAQKQLGNDPANDRAEVRRAAGHTLGAEIVKYLAVQKQKLKPRSYVETKRHLEKDWKPLHGIAIASIGRANVAATMAVLAKERGPVTANRDRASLSAFYRWAIGEGLCDQNPVTGTNRQEESGPRERALSDAELAKVWLAAPDDDYGRIMQLLILTGCRREEIGGLKQSEIDLEARTLTLPPDRTKNSQEHVVPLSEAAHAILKAIPPRDREHVFGTGNGGFGGWSKSKEKIEQAAKLKADWTLHDIRRTVRTGLGKLGVQPHVAEAILNHLPAKLIRTYDRNTYAAEKKAALDLWAAHLKVAVAQSTGANVSALRKA